MNILNILNENQFCYSKKVMQKTLANKMSGEYPLVDGHAICKTILYASKLFGKEIYPITLFKRKYFIRTMACLHL